MSCSGNSLRSGMTRSGTVFPLQPLAHPTGGIGSGLLPTPVAKDDGKSYEAHMAMKARMPGGPRKTCTSLAVMARSGMWPTPTRSEHTGPGHAAQGGMNLRTAVHLWPTPAARDYRSESCSPEFQEKRDAETRGKTLPWMVKKFPTPTANRRNGLQSHGVNVVSGSLNPTWVEWLMGFPLGWTVCEAWETRSSRRSRKSSAAPSSTTKARDD
jgi:hypothetical protein